MVSCAKTILALVALISGRAVANARLRAPADHLGSRRRDYTLTPQPSRLGGGKAPPTSSARRSVSRVVHNRLLRPMTGGLRLDAPPVDAPPLGDAGMLLITSAGVRDVKRYASSFTMVGLCENRDGQNHFPPASA